MIRPSEEESGTDREKAQYDVALRNRAYNMLVLRGIVAAYLLYLGGSLIYNHLTGASSMSALTVWLVGVLFAVGGPLFGVFAWRRFRADLRSARLPESPSDGEPD